MYWSGGLAAKWTWHRSLLPTPYYTNVESIAMDVAVPTRQPIFRIIPELRAALRQASPELANSSITAMDQIVENSYGSQHLAARPLESSSTLRPCRPVSPDSTACWPNGVSQRTSEMGMGVRFALGARRGEVICLILCQASILDLAFASTCSIRSYHYGAKAHDGWTPAAYLPARRATQVNPVGALCAEQVP